MKKIVTKLFLSVTAILLVSCNSDNNPNHDKFNDVPDTGYIAFETPNDTLDLKSNGVECGGSDTLRIPLRLKSIIDNGFYPFANTPTNENGFDVNYTITDVVGNSSDVDVKVDFRANTSEGSILVIAPASLISDVEFKITINGTSNSNVRLQTEGENAVSQEMYVRVNNTTRAALYGQYKAAQALGNGNPSTYVDGDNNIIPLKVNPGTASNELILRNVFNQEAENGPTFTRVFINADGTLSFPAFADNLLYVSSIASVGNVFVEGQSGTYDSCTGTIIMKFRLRRGAAQSATGVYTLTLTRL